MKRVIFACTLILGTMLSEAQSWNPYVSQGIISPLMPGEFREPGVASFNIGNSGSSALLYDNKNPDNNISLVIYLSKGIPDKKNPLTALGGPGAGYFDWSYDALSHTFTGAQKRDIPGYFQTSVTIGYQVENNSSLVTASNGVKIVLHVPAYLGGSNTTQDDMVSSYTYTKAFDYGDAPESYGTARHEIDLTKDPETGLYTHFILLGTKIDPEPVADYSETALGDNSVGIDDEDGVVFPPLYAGHTAVIPVVATVYGESFGILNVWFDWNGDGDFLDPGEKVYGTPLPVYTSGTYKLTVNVPDDAVINKPTFARFRIGANMGPDGDNIWGEVEDYSITIHSSDTVVGPESVITKTEIVQYDGLDISVYPNPVTDKYHIYISREGKYRLELINSAGSVVFTGMLDITSGNGRIATLSRDNLVSGLYIMRISGMDKDVYRTLKITMIQQK